MKKRIFSRVLALFMALSLLTTTVFAASFDDLQNAINGEGGTPIGEENRYGWSQNENGWGIEAWGTEDGRNVQLNENVTYTESDTNSTITIDKDQNVNLDLNDNNITGDGEHNVIDVTGNLTITGADSKTPEDGTHNTIKGGEIGINVEQGGELALGGVTVTGNDIGVAFVPESFVTFIGDQNVVSGNKAKNIDGTGKVNFELGETTYKVDAKTAETLLAGKDSVAAYGTDWILAENGTVIYTGTGDAEKQLTKGIVNGVLNAASKAGDTISGFVIPEGVESIGSWVFTGKSNIKTITLPSTLKTIADHAFQSSGLENITIPANVEIIGERAFEGCENLTTVSISAKEIGKGAFVGCTNLESVTLSEGVVKIGNSAFFNRDKLKNITFPSTLTTIDVAAFKNCGLEKVIIPTNVTSMGKGAFSGCASLAEAEIYGALDIPEGAFQNLQGLQTVKVSGEVKSIGNSAFANSQNLKTVEISSDVASIGDAAFSQCYNLKTISLPKNAKFTSIGSTTFYKCENLTEVVIPEGVTNIGDWAFGGCSKITNIKIPDTVTTIGEGAFGWCPNIKTITIPEGVTVVGDKVLEESPGVKSIWIPFEERSETAAKIVAEKTDANIFIKEDTENLSFCRGNVFADFGHYNADADVNLEDGSVALLTNVRGTITTGSDTVALPNVPGITVSIDTDGNITVNVPSAITVKGTEYPYGADVTVDPNGNISARERPSDDPPVISFDFDAITADTSTTIEDEEVPLAGLVTLAELLEALREYEGIEDVELPEDFQWADHDYAQAIYWGLDEALVVDTEDDPLDPDEIVTVALLREVLENFVEYKGANLTVTVEGEDDMIVMDLGERLTVFYGELEAALSKQAA